MKKTITILMTILCIAALTACAPATIKMQDGAAQTLQGKPLTIVHYQSPPFSIMTPGKGLAIGLTGGLGGAVVGATAAHEGKTMTDQYQLPDPSNHVAEVLSSDWRKTYALGDVHIAPQTVSDDDPKHVADLANHQGLALDVRTYNWMYVYYPFSWTHYKMIYLARARLIDASTAQVLRQEKCKVELDDGDKAPTYDQLFADNAAVIKAQAIKAAEQCVATRY